MKTPNLSQELVLAKNTALRVGELQLRHLGSNLEIIRKSCKDLVSNVDIKCQKLCTDLLSDNSEYDIISEEKRINKIPSEGCFWIIDPIDGTHNYISGIPIFGVSIALATIDEVFLGVIYIPFFKYMYYAVKGGGAFLNDQAIKVSENKNIEKSMINYDNQLHNSTLYMDRYKNIIDNSFTTRILGSAIFDFGLVSSGLIDARIFNDTKIFDLAAGLIIVQEAGGLVTDFSGNTATVESKDVVASNGRVHEQLLDLLIQTQTINSSLVGNL